VAADALAVPSLPQAEPSPVPGIVAGRTARLHVRFPDVLAVFVAVVAKGAVQVFGVSIMVEGNCWSLGCLKGRVEQKSGLRRAIRCRQGDRDREREKTKAEKSRRRRPERGFQV
jgi:hypothetical protein